MQRTDSGLGLVSNYGDEEDDDALDRSGSQDADGVDTISGSDDESAGAHAQKVVNTAALKRLHEKLELSPERKPSPLVAAYADEHDEDEPPKKPAKLEKVSTVLVSYGAADDEDNEDVDMGSETDEKVEDLQDWDLARDTKVDSSGDAPLPRTLHKSGDDVALPPEPPGKPSKRVQDTIERLYKSGSNSSSLNMKIQARKDFRNPSIYEKLIEFCGIDEKGTNYPPELFDPHLWGPESYYDALAKAQKVEMDKREKDRKERSKVEFITATKKTVIDGETKRKTKWDAQPQVVPGVVSGGTITTSISGTKTTVIPAVGVITKKK